MDPVPPVPAPQPTPPVVSQVEKPKSKTWMQILISVVLLGVGVVAGILLGKQFYSQPVLVPTPTPEVRYIPPADPTANWKTYSGSSYSFRYPPQYQLSTLGESLPLLNRRIYWSNVPISYKDCSGGCPIVSSAQPATIGGITATKIKGWIGEIGGSFAQSYIKYEAKLPNQNLYFQISLWELPQDIQPSEYPAADRKVQDISKEDEDIFDQILSTFKFQ